MSSNSVENPENICVVCFKNIEIYSIGSCDHTVCYECSTRMRVLCQQNECPICRQELPKVVFVSNVRPFSELQHYTILQDRKFKICFENGKIQDAFYKLLENNCSVCPNSPSFRSFQALYDHMRREHELYYCDLCVEHLKIFTSERRCYTRSELALHRKKGDIDDKSHRGHPLCQFCDVRYMDNDCLYRHLRREHLFCHFCDADGYDLYYSSYDYLREHFRDEHYLCEEGACIDEKFTPVFRTEIDLKAHKASVHGRTMGKAAAKQARTLELEFTLKPRLRQQDAPRRGKPRTFETGYANEEGAVGGSEQNPSSRSDSPTLNPSEFPSLPSGSGSTTIITPGPPQRGRSAGLTIHAVGRRNTPLEITDENFPVLGLHNEATSQGTSVRLNINQDRSSGPGRSTITPRNVSIHVNHRANGEQNIRIRQDDFPALSKNKSNQIPTAKWVVSSKKPNPPSAPPPQRPISLDCEFPSLNSRFNANLNFKTSEPTKPNTTKNSNSSSKENNKTDDKKIKKASSVMIPVRSEWPDSQNDSSTSNSLKNKTKKKKTKTTNNHEAEKADTAKKKDDASETSKNNNNINNNNKESSALSKTTSNEFKSGKPLPTAEDWFEGCKKLEKRKEDEEEIDWFENNGTTNFSLGSLGISGISASDNLITRNKVKTKAPPGFDNLNGFRHPEVKKPPPGFSMELPRNNGLTFTNSSGQSYAISTDFDYTPPDEFEIRNRNLITKVNEILLNDVNLKEFRKMSAGFRQDKISAEEYYDHCVRTMGELGFHEIFPELLVLLPDINKQQELFRVYSKVRNFQKGKRKLECCEICRQVVSNSDYKRHLAHHSLQQNFPLLSADGWTK